MQKKGEKDLKSIQKAIQMNQEQFNSKIINLDRLVMLWRTSYAKKTKQENFTSNILQYTQYKQEFDNIDSLRRHSNIKPIKFEEETKYAESEKEVFLGTYLFEQKDWKVSFSKVFIEKNIILKNRVNSDVIFSNIYLFSQGFISFNSNRPNYFRLIQKSRKSGLQYYTIHHKVKNQSYFLLASIGVHRIPQYNHKVGNQSRIELFNHFLVITFEDIILEETLANKKQMKNIINQLEQFYENNPKVNFKREELVLDEAKMSEKKVYFHTQKINNGQEEVKVYPTLFRNMVPCQLMAEEYSFQAEKFIEYQIRTQFTKTKELKKLDIYSFDHEDMIEELQAKAAENINIEFRSHRKIIKNLEQIPKFKYALTQQQRQILSLQGNLIVVGRSGTGKTTCAMLRLYGIDQSQEDRATDKNSQKCLMVALDKIKLMKNVFLTFSGMLISQIKKQYDDMTLQIRTKHAQTCHSCLKLLQQNRIEDHETEDPLDQINIQNQKQEEQVIALHQIRMCDFPGFFTIENFARIIDKTLQRPFFSQKKQHNRPDRDNIVIKHAYVNLYRYGLDSIEKLTPQKAVRVDYQFFLEQIWNTLPKNLTRHTEQYPLLIPSIVWSQIFSIIKGSLSSYQCPGGFISLKMYIDDHQSIFQTEQNMQQYKIRVYKIFKSYMNWCKFQRNAYDFMDVVNHLLKQIEFYGYKGPKINYMFIDQVQDLTSSTIFLLSKMVINNIFYCGDSAQAITKGVIFRFDNLKLIFNKQYCKNALELQYPQDIFYLTVNFRSHNLILQLANSIIMTIQSLFPSLINKVKKERSDLIGPMPFVLLNQSTQTLLDLICNRKDVEKQKANKKRPQFNKEKMKRQKKRNEEQQHLLFGDSDSNKSDQDSSQSEQSDQQQRRLNSQQVIIIRNKAEKKKLPKCLQQGIILIPQTAKGLQFDEIILYNFFSSCPIFEKWNSLLQHIQPEFFWQSQKQFQTELNKRAKEENMESVPLTLQAKILLGYDVDKRSYKIWGLRAKNSLKQIEVNLYYELATQLKILYTAITRARSVFIICDEKIPRNLLKIWKELNLIKFIDSSNAEQNHKIIHKYVHIEQKHEKHISKQLLWFKAGKKCLARKDLENAKRCFANIKRQDLVDRIIAQQKAAKAENELYRIDNEYDNLEKLGRDDRKIAKFKLQRRKIKALKLFEEAAQLNLAHNRQNEAADFYFKAQAFQQALQVYKRLVKIDKMALCYKKLHLIKEAIPIFMAVNDIESLISCYKQQKDWLELSYLLVSNYSQVAERINSTQLEIIKRSCMKQMLNNVLASPKTKEKIESFKQFYGLSLRNNLDNKRILNRKQIAIQPNRFILEYQFNDLRSLQSQLQQKLKQSKNLWQKQHDLKIKLSEICQSQEINKDQLKSCETKIKKNQRSVDDVKRELLKYQMKFSHGLLRSNKDQLKYSDGLKHLKQQKRELLNRQDYLLEKENSLYHDCQKVTNELENLQDYIQVKKIENWIMLASQRLSEVTIQLKQLIQVNALKQRIEKYNNTDFDIVSLSDISQMTQTWEFQKNSIGGISLFQPDKQNLIQTINQILIDNSLLIEEEIEECYSIYNHNYINKALEKFLIDKPSPQIQRSFLNLKKCDTLGANMVCLLVCDTSHFVCLASKYIVNAFLEKSNNFRQARYFREQKFQVNREKLQIKPEKHQVQQKKLNQVQQLLVSLQNKALTHKVPRIGFEGKWYNETIASQIVFNLVLQGYCQQSLLLQQPGSACQLANIYLSYDQLTEHAKKILKKPKDKVPKWKFYFIGDEIMINTFPEALILNVASIQNIIYVYDQCQEQHFLTKLPKLDQIDISEVQIKQFYDQTAINRIKQMQSMRKNILKRIEQNQTKIDYLFQCKRKKIVQRDIIEEYAKNQAKVYEKRSEKLHQQREKIEKQLKQADIQYNYAVRLENQARIPRKKRFQYEKKMQDLKTALQIEGQRKTKQQQIETLSKQYDQMAKNEKQSYDNLQKKKLRLQQKKWKLQINSHQILQNYRKKQENEIRIYSYSIPEIREIYENEIFACQNKIKQLQSQIPKEIQVQPEEQRIDAVVKLLIKEQKQRQLNAKIDVTKKFNMYQIQRDSNIPKDHHYRFLRQFINGRLYQMEFEILSELYYKILDDGIEIESLVNSTSSNKQNENNINIRICNAIILYLTYIGNKPFRQHFDSFIEYASNLFEQDYQERQSLQSKIVMTANQINNYLAQLNKIPSNQKNRFNRAYNNLSHFYDKAKTRYQQYQIMLRQFKGFPSSPIQLFGNFSKGMYERINNINRSNMYFMELLFGFFQCKIIRQCQVLDFLSDQYVLVRHNSKVIQHLLSTHKDEHAFAYYFDQQEKTVLCRFQDVSKIIIGIVNTKHIQVLQNYYDVDDFEKAAYVGLASKRTTQNQAFLDLSIALNRQDQKQIKMMYEKFFIKDTLLEEIRALKRLALEYYLKERHKKPDDYYFASHQIRQYYFLEKIMKSMNLFSANLIKDVVKKKEKLKQQFLLHTKKK